MYALFASLGVSITVEEATNIGRMDMVFTYQKNTFIFEFKTDNNIENPIQQILDRGYPQKYQRDGQHIWLVGIVFHREERNIGSFGVQQYC